MNVYLIGYRGSGKSTVGAVLAESAGVPFCDLDVLIETGANRSIAEVFRLSGEAAFRELEANTLAKLATGPSCVMATGGGVILLESNRVLMRRTGLIVWLQAPAETLWARIASDPLTAARRPNLTATGGLAEVIRLLAEREPLYRSTAQLVLDATASPTELAAAILPAWSVLLPNQSDSA